MSAPVLHLSCDRDVLVTLLGRVERIVEKRSTMPILMNVLLSADTKGVLTVKGTDLDRLAEASADQINVSQPGATTVGGKLLYDALRKMPAGIVTLSATMTALTVKGGRARSTLHTMPATDFPAIKYGEATHRFQMKGQDLLTIADKCGFSIGTEETRYYLCGVYLHAIEHKLMAVSTDGSRMSSIALDLPDGAAGMPGAIVPSKMVELFGHVAGKGETSIDVEVCEEFIRFATEHVSITSKLLYGTYPDYSRVIPRGNNQVALVDLQDLSDAIERLMVHRDEGHKAFKLVFTEGALHLHCRSDKGEAEDEIPAECGFELEIGFNGKFMQELVKTLRGPKVRLAMGDPSSPPLISDEGDDRREIVLMPMRI